MDLSVICEVFRGKRDISISHADLFDRSRSFHKHWLAVKVIFIACYSLEPDAIRSWFSGGWNSLGKFSCRLGFGSKSVLHAAVLCSARLYELQWLAVINKAFSGNRVVRNYGRIDRDLDIVRSVVSSFSGECDRRRVRCIIIYYTRNIIVIFCKLISLGQDLAAIA